jgi:hypothetical protein
MITFLSNMPVQNTYGVIVKGSYEDLNSFLRCCRDNNIQIIEDKHYETEAKIPKDGGSCWVVLVQRRPYLAKDINELITQHNLTHTP